MTKKSRYNKIMQLQKEISKENLEKNMGRELEVLIEDKTFDNKYYIGRSYMDVPEIDGIVYVKNDENLNFGEFIKCKVTKVDEYDLVAKKE